ncbi:peptidase S8/S53 domain-containing protein [Lasiosphaeria ovina]|uniref:Peptidase S8/S53 domain-containing protein n=1 Tax=Lasiosphaeria ovina TaxID=92902 RepID=A0AAE0NA37_9PEZI|nr:peptidase S8/S53 domain-containing protein [Lasiosphaeria ovina]
MKFSAVFAAVATLLAIPLAVADAPVKNEGISAEVVIPDKYIVKYKDNADPTKKKKHEQDVTAKAKKSKKGGVVENIDIDGLSGYVAEIPSSELKDLTSSPLVEYVEKDAVVNHTAVAAEPLSPEKRALVTQANAQWGLGRISHRGRGNSGYTYDTTAGLGVRVYVIDTGVKTTHADFGGRAVWGANFVGGLNTDEYGHGTHVAATIAGTTYGVAKRATIVAVKVLDKNGVGSISGVIAGINWAVKDAKNRGVAKKAVINMSLGGGTSSALNAAVAAATNAGLTVVVAAGNNNGDASGISPASAPSAITVAAVEGTDYRAWFSNFGARVDLFAPGVSILSAYIGSNSATAYLSGTSMAAPHVAGLAAYFIAKEGLSGSTAVTNRILSAASVNYVSDVKGSPNRLAYNANGL